MTSDSALFRTRAQLEDDGWTLDGNVFTRGSDRHLPLYEAKMLHHFDHRWATYTNGDDVRDLTLAEHQDPTRLALPRYWVPEHEVDARLRDRWPHNWLLGWRKTCRSTDERTLIASLVTRSGVGDKYQLMFPGTSRSSLTLLANLNSFVADFVARQKLGGTDLSFYLTKQVPILQPEACSALWTGGPPFAEWLTPRVLELTYTAWDLQPFAADLGYDGPPFRWDPERRFLLRCELDAAFFHLYGIDRDDAAYILDTFPIVRRKDEAAHGEYRTKRIILDIYDDLALASDTGKPYRTRLDPPPADPSQRHEAT